MNNNSATLSTLSSNVTSIFDPQYSAIGIGTSPYYVGDRTSTTGDPLWGNNYKVGEWTYTNNDWYTDQINQKPIDAEMIKAIQEWYNRQQATKTTTTKVTTNTDLRQEMETSDDVGFVLAEMINEL